MKIHSVYLGNLYTVSTGNPVMKMFIFLTYFLALCWETFATVM